LMKLDTIVCPDTLLRWHRQFVSQKWNFSPRRGPGRPGIMREISELIMRMARTIRGGGTPAFREPWPISVTRLVAGRLPMC
jgi:hypothetical protein